MRLRNLSIKAIGAGLCADVAGSVAVGLALMMAIAIVSLVGQDRSLDNLESLRTNTYVRIAGLLGTTFSTVLGGYVAARLSRPNGLINSLAVGLLSVALAVTLAVAAPGVTPLWKLILGLILTVPAALVGAHLAMRSKS